MAIETRVGLQVLTWIDDHNPDDPLRKQLFASRAGISLGMTRGELERPGELPERKPRGLAEDDLVLSCRRWDPRGWRCGTTMVVHADEAIDVAQYSELMGVPAHMLCERCGTPVPFPEERESGNTSP